MYSANNQDEAMLSERNELDPFQSDLSSPEDNDSIEIDNQSEQNSIQNQQTNEKYQEQQVIQAEKQKKEIKNTCFSKVKGYFGFGNFITNSNIGYVFCIPISNQLSFKIQVMLTQLIVAIISLSLFVSIRLLGLKILQNELSDYSTSTFYDIQLQQIYSTTQQFLTYMNITEQLYTFFAQSMSQTMQYKQIQWGNEFRIQMDQNLDDNATKFVNSSIIDYYTQTYGTYTNIQDNVNSEQLSQYLNINYFLRTQYYPIKMNFFWIMNDGFMLQYPGINVTNITLFKQYRQEIYQDKSQLLEFTYDNIIQNFILRDVQNIENQNQSIIGNVFIETTPEIIYNLFLEFSNSSLLNYTFIILNNDSTIIYTNNQLDEELTSILQSLTKNNTNYNEFFNVYDQHRLKENDYDENDIDDHGYWAQDQFKIYQGYLSLVPYSIAIVRLSYVVAIVYNYTLLQQQLDYQESQFEGYTEVFVKQYLPICVTVPFLYILIILFFLKREIKPLEETTVIAKMSLIKQMALDEKILLDIKGNGLISHLTSLLKKLMLDLNQLKIEKRKQIIKFYNSQTYPNSHKIKNVNDILEEITKIEEEQKTMGSPLLLPNFDD